METVECIGLMPGVELRPCELDIISMWYDVGYAIFKDGTCIGSVNHSRLPDEQWDATIGLGTEEWARKSSFSIAAGKGETPFEAIVDAFDGSDKDLKLARDSLRALSLSVLGRTRGEPIPELVKRKPNRLRFAKVK